MSKKPNMQAALMGQVATPAQAQPAAAPRAVEAANDAPAAKNGRAPSRVGKKQIGAWLNPDFDRSLLLVMAKSPTGTDKQTLIAEALNDLFSKYNVPTVRND